MHLGGPGRRSSEQYRLSGSWQRIASHTQKFVVRECELGLCAARIYADDCNTAAASGFWVANLRAGLEQRTENWRKREAFSVENIANRTYVGSVIVNEGNSRFFEQAQEGWPILCSMQHIVIDCHVHAMVGTPLAIMGLLNKGSYYVQLEGRTGVKS